MKTKRKEWTRQAAIAEIRLFLTRLAAMVVLLWVIFGLIFGICPMKNEDMMPRISSGDLLLYYRLQQDFVSGDVIVLQKDGKQYVSRVVAHGGDTVEITEDAQLSVNGSTVIENDIYYSTPQYEGGITYPVTLADNEVFVLCDYREGAKDSRYFGPVSKSEIKGKVITIVRRSNL